MASKPDDVIAPTLHLAWDHSRPMQCPLCGHRLAHEYNDGGRKVETLKGSMWVVTNYYKCTNHACDMHKAFPAANNMTLTRKKFSLDVWAKVIQHRFKHKMNYTQIEQVMWDDWCVSIAQGTIKSICEFFEAAGKARVDEETLALVKSNGRIVLSLDGAQPEKGRPAFWVFTDRLTGRILLTRYLEIASADVLAEIFKEIEKVYGVPIKAVISDKQRSIVNAVKEFNPKIPHVFCQYHFLHHVREPIAAKDSHLLTMIRSKIKVLSIVQKRPTSDTGTINSNSPVSNIFAPIAQELLCAVEARGDRFSVFPGLEAYSNLSHVLARLVQCKSRSIIPRVKVSLDALTDSLHTLVDEYALLASEIGALAMDFGTLRAILKHRAWKGKKIKEKVDAWVYMLQTRLKRRNVEYDPEKIKWMNPTYNMSLVDAWQQWVRLVASYEDGLYAAYDDPELDFTNNAKEGLFSRTKHHFRSTYGREDIQDEFEMHADPLVRLLDFDYEPDNVKEVLLTADTALVDAFRDDLHAVYLSTRRKWRIREEETGNFDRFAANIDALLGSN